MRSSKAAGITSVDWRRASLVGAISIGSACPSLALGQSDGITILRDFVGGGSIAARAVSLDGNVVVGSASPNAPMFEFIRAFRWTAQEGLVNLGSLGPISEAQGVSGDGTVVVGYTSDLGIYLPRAFRWTQASGMVDLGLLPNGDYAIAYGVNRDGSVVVGAAGTGFPFPSPARAFRWTQGGGMVNLGTLNGGASSSAAAINGDGSVVVGRAGDGTLGNSERAFRWTQGTGMVSLGTLSGVGESRARGVSMDGKVVVGQSTAGNVTQAFRWSQTGGMHGLGFLTEGSFSSASSVSGDGNVVVGSAALSASGSRRAFRWTQTSGMQSVESWLRANGISVPVDVTAEATGVSADGNVVVGNLERGFAFLARVEQAGSGLVTLQDLQTSLQGNTNAGIQAASLGGMVLNGAHSRPLAQRVAPGKSCLWMAGDAGRDDHGERDGTLGLIEIGGCYGFSENIQGSISVGRTSSRQNLVFNGRSSVSTTYGMAEVLGRIPGTNLWPSAALMLQTGDADARRGYLNAGVQDTSLGRPAVRSAAVRLRMDWDEAVRTGNVAFTPYADVSHARTRVDGYTEVGGGFPAQFDVRKERATEARIGVDTAIAVTATTKLLGRLEAVHRFDRNSAATSGTVLGLFGFNLPGHPVKRDWLRAGIGFDTRLGTGTVSAFLNTTTEGAAASQWVNLAYRVSF